MRRFFIMTTGLLLTLSLTACGTSAPAMDTKAPTEGQMFQLANPYLTLSTKEEMEAEAGFEISLPETLPSWVTETIYRTIPGELIEVIYTDAERTNEIRVRAAHGSKDISGVYDTDAREEKDTALKEHTVHLKGESLEDGSFSVFVSTWNTPEDRTYSVTSTAGVPEEVLLPLLKEIR